LGAQPPATFFREAIDPPLHLDFQTSAIVTDEMATGEDEAMPLN
jgi:hypothetical protein